jgi:hypothetical protein
MGWDITGVIPLGRRQLPVGLKLPANRFEPKFLAEALYNQTDWPVIFGITGPICARALEI